MSEKTKSPRSDAEAKNNKLTNEKDTKKARLTQRELAAFAEDGEKGSGQMFAMLYRNEFLAEKVNRGGKPQTVWYKINDNGYWEIDIKENVIDKMSAMGSIFLDAAEQLSQDKSSKTYNASLIQLFNRAASRLNKLSFCRNATGFTSIGDTTLAFIGENFDQKKNLIPCRNGLLDPIKCSIDENTGKIKTHGKTAFRPLRPDDYIRKVFVEFDPDAECPEFEAFLDSALDGHTEDGQEVINYLQTVAGYALLGNPCLDVWFLMFSARGRSGKGVFSDCLNRVFGDYSCTAKSSIFLKKLSNDPNRPDPAIMALKDKRLVIMSEQGKGEAFDAAEVKTKTSGRDQVSARALYGQEENFFPTYVFLQSTNDLPRVNGDDEAFWARLVLIPFPYHFTEEPDPKDPEQKQIDTKWKDRLEAETPGILNWCIKGAIRYLANGSKLPAVPKLCKLAKRKYRFSQDSIAQFLNDCCIIDPNAKAPAKALYEEYSRWSESVGKRKSNIVNFSDSLLRKGFEKRHLMNGNTYLGIGLRNENS